jgi:hypothetical protein
MSWLYMRDGEPAQDWRLRRRVRSVSDASNRA